MSNLFKKVTSTTSALAIVATAMSSSLTAFAASEFATFADSLAEAGVINTQSSEAGYRLGDNITRAEMAKIAVVLADDTAVECAGDVFSDVTSAQGDLCGFIESAAALEIVSTANTKFRPSDLVTRAEMVKMLLSARGVAPTDVSAEFDDVPASMGDLYGYVNAAVAEGLIKAGTSFRPNATATRGEAFKVAAGALAIDNGGTVTPPVDTGTGTTSTGSTSTGVVTPVASGDLGLNLNPSSPANGAQIPSTGIVRAAVVDFTAGGSDVSVNTVELKKAGLANLPTGTKVWFEKAGTRLSGKASFTSENNAVVSFAPSLVVTAGTASTLDLYVELSGATTGDDLQLFSAAVVSSAKNTTGSFMTPTLRVTGYTVASSTFTANPSGQTYNASSSSEEFAKFTIANTDTNNDTRDLKLQSVLLYQSGSANLTNLSDITVEKNGVVVSSAAVVSGKMLTLTIADTIKDGGTAIYTVKAKINNVELTTDTYQFYLKNTSDVNLIEETSGFRSNLTATTPVNAALYSVNGGDVKFTRDTAVALSQTVAPGTDNVTLLKGTITSKSAVTLEDVTLNYTADSIASSSVTSVTAATGSVALNTTTTTTATTSDNASMNTVYLQIGSSTFTATPSIITKTVVTTTGVSPTSTGTTTTTVTPLGTLTFLGTATVTGEVPVRVYSKLKDAATGNIKVGTFNIGSVTRKEYAINQNTVSSAIGSIDGIQITVGASTLNVSRTDGLGATKLASGSKGVTVYKAKFSSTQGNEIALSNFSVVTTGTANSYTGGNTSLTLYVDGVAKDTKNVNTTSVSFGSFNATVSTTKSVEVEIKADFSDVTTTGNFQISSIGYDAVDNLTSVNLSSKPSVVGALFTVASPIGALAATTGDDLVNKTLLLSGDTAQKITGFKVTASNDVIRLRNITLTGTGLDALSNIRLTDSVGTVLGTASNVTNTGAKFANLDTAAGSSIAMDKSATYFVVADVNSTTDAIGVQANVVITSLGNTDIVGSNGSAVLLAGVTATGALHDVAQNTFKVAQTTPTSKSLSTNALEFTVHAYGKNEVTLSGVTLDTVLGAYSASSATGVISVYTKDNQLVGSKVVGTATGTTSTTVTFDNYNVIGTGKNTTYVVKVEGFTLNASTNEAWTVKLTQLEVGTLKAADYVKNAETFPLTSVK